MIACIPEHVRRSFHITETNSKTGGVLHLSNGFKTSACDRSECSLVPFLSHPFQEGQLAWGASGYDWCDRCEQILISRMKNDARDIKEA